MKCTGLLRAAVAVFSVTIWGCSRAESTKTPASEPADGTPATVGTGGAGANLKSDPDFVRDVALKGMAARELSRLALGRSADANVRAFAQIVLDDHAAAENALKAIVADQGIQWPAQLDDKHRKTAGELAAKQGLDFDREYMDAMVDEHQDFAAKLESRLDVQSVADWKTAAAARTESRAMPDPKVAMRDVAVRPAASDSGLTAKINRWAADTYPVAQKHLDSARALENVVKKRSTD